MKKRGQEAMEYFVLFGLVTLIIAIAIFLFVRYSSETQDTIIIESAENIGKALVTESEKVYFYGKGSINTVKIGMPANIGSIKGDGRQELIINMVLSKGSKEIIINSQAPIQADISINMLSGSREFNLKSEGAYVNISEVI